MLIISELNLHFGRLNFVILI